MSPLARLAVETQARLPWCMSPSSFSGVALRRSRHVQHERRATAAAEQPRVQHKRRVVAAAAQPTRPAQTKGGGSAGDTSSTNGGRRRRQSRHVFSMNEGWRRPLRSASAPTASAMIMAAGGVWARYLPRAASIRHTQTPPAGAAVLRPVLQAAPWREGALPAPTTTRVSSESQLTATITSRVIAATQLPAHVLPA